MSSKIDWKQKYEELRSKYLNAIDVAFRLGVQEGQKSAQMENMQMQMQQMQAQAQQMQQMQAQGMGGGAAPGEQMPPEEGAMPGQEGVMPEEGAMPPEDQQMAEGAPAGDELDQNIDELEQYVKSEDKNKNKQIDFSKMMKSLHKTEKQKSNSSDSEKKQKIDEILKKW